MTRNETPIGKGDTITPGQAARVYPVTRPAEAAGQLLGVSVDASGLAVDASVTVTVEANIGGGNNWQSWCSVTARGGINAGRQVFAATPPPSGVRVRLAALSTGRAVQAPMAFVELT